MNKIPSSFVGLADPMEGQPAEPFFALRVARSSLEVRKNERISSPSFVGLADPLGFEKMKGLARPPSSGSLILWGA